MSKTILTDILRGDMGFEGVVICDALNMAAITDNFTDEDMLRLTINAGVDLLLLPPLPAALFVRCPLLPDCFLFITHNTSPSRLDAKAFLMVYF